MEYDMGTLGPFKGVLEIFVVHKVLGHNDKSSGT